MHIKSAEAIGSIRGLSLNLIGGDEAAINFLYPNGILGEIKDAINRGDTRDAIFAIGEAERMAKEIRAHALTISANEMRP